MRLVRVLFEMIFFTLISILLIPSMLGLFITFIFFKVIFIILLIGLLINNIMKMNVFEIGFSMILLVILCVVPFGLLTLMSWKILLTTLIIGIGLYLIFKKDTKNYINYKKD